MSSDVNRRFKLAFYGSQVSYDELTNNINAIRSSLAVSGHKLSTMDIISKAVEKFLSSDKPSTQTSSTVRCSKDTADEKITFTTQSAIENLTRLTSDHRALCPYPVKLTFRRQTGCVTEYNVECDHCKFCCAWLSSPILPDGKELVNLRLTHAYISSGMLPSHFERFCDVASLGQIPQNQMTERVKQYAKCVENERILSCANAIHEEIGISSTDGIDIVTDARHSTRRNSKYSDIVCIGYNSHKVLDHILVRRDDDPCSQRHEMFGTKKLYDNFDAQNVTVRRHAHDRNASVNKFVREKRSATTNQNDTWHVSVSIEKEMKKVSAGAKCREGKTWSVQLADKVQPIKTHVNYAMRNCNGDVQTLRASLDNVVKHYMNIHTNCSKTSRCQKDSNYMPSRILLTDSVAIRLLTDVIKACDVYKHAENYVHHMDTFFVESFNNTINMFQDKRIGAFGDIQYAMRSNLAVCHWNENVKTSTGQKNRLTYTYRENIWAKLIDNIFSNNIWRPF